MKFNSYADPFLFGHPPIKYRSNYYHKFKYYSDIIDHFHRLNKYRHHSSCHIFTNFLGVRAYQMHPPTNLYDKTYCTENDHKRVSSIKEIADIFKRVHGKNLKQLSNKGIAY